MRTTLTLMLACAFIVSHAQTPTEVWYRTYDGAGMGFDEIRYVRMDAQNNIVVTGRAWNGSSHLDVVTRKYDPAGEVIWTNTWNSTDFGFDDEPKGMEIAANGDVIIVGNSSHSDDPQSNNADIFIFALSSDGDPLWSDSFSGTGYVAGGGWTVNGSNAAGVAITQAGEIFVSGFVTGNGSTEHSQMVIAKYDAAGDQLWLEKFDHATDWSNTDLGLDIDVDAAGNAYVCGTTALVTTWRDPTVWKVDGNGQFQWISTYAGPDNNTSEQFDQILVDDAGNSYAFGKNSSSKYVLRKHDPAGVAQWTHVLDTINPSTTASFSGPDKQLAFDMDGNIILVAGMDSRIGVAKFTPAGDILWITLHGGNTMLNNEAYHVVVDGMNNIYVSGAPSNSGTSYDLGCFKIAPDGSEVWYVWHNGPANGNDKGHSMAVAADGSVYVGGLATGYTASNGDYILAKYSQGPVSVPEIDQTSLLLYPNPATDIVTVDLTGGSSYLIELMDHQGRIVRATTRATDTGPTPFSLEGIVAGGYLLRVHSNERSIVAPLVIQ